MACPILNGKKISRQKIILNSKHNSRKTLPIKNDGDHCQSQHHQLIQATVNSHNILSELNVLMKKKRTLMADIREIYLKSRTVGFDIKFMRQTIKIPEKKQDF